MKGQGEAFRKRNVSISRLSSRGRVGLDRLEGRECFRQRNSSYKARKRKPASAGFEDLLEFLEAEIQSEKQGRETKARQASRKSGGSSLLCHACYLALIPKALAVLSVKNEMWRQ